MRVDCDYRTKPTNTLGEDLNVRPGVTSPNY